MSLLELLPGFYGGSLETADLENAIEPEILRLWADRDGIFDQLNIDTATWGLALWERDLGLPVEAEKPLPFRRSRILSKLRGQGTTTVAMIRNVAESFSNGAVDVVEHPGDYTFDVQFTGTIGIPPNMDDLSAAIEELKPAHLGYQYIILFRTWLEVGKKS
ncbi:MAG: putative phage tail protein, partial [Oscillospiraceae bacterium]